MLLFKARFLPLIRAGTKTQTIRLWRTPRVKPGQHAYVPGLGRVTITHVDTLPCLSDLRAADAHADGFASRRALLAEIRRLYRHTPKLPRRHIFRIRFTYQPASQQPTRAPARPSPRPAARASAPSALHPKPSRQTLARFLRALAPHVSPARP